MTSETDTLALKAGESAVGGWLGRNGWACATLLLPFMALTCDARWEVAATAACISVLLIPGLLFTRWLFPCGHPLAAFPAGFGTAMTMSLLFFALPALFALKLHWRLPTFLVVLGVMYATTCAALVTSLIRRREHPRAFAVEIIPAFQFPSAAGRAMGLVVLLAAALTGLGVALGARTDTQDWRAWTLAGLGGGLLALIAFGLSAARARARPDAPSPSAAEPTNRPHFLEPWLTGLLWTGIAVLTVYMMKSSYARPGYAMDDVTYVSQAVDFLSGAPMDRYEPSLGLDIPMEPGFVIGTVPLLAATISWATGIPPAALQHTLLYPVFALGGICSLAGLLAVLLRRRALLIALALALLMVVLLKTNNGNRSVVTFMVYRVMQPKSIHLLVIYPIQLALMLLTVTQPSRGHTAGAIFAAIVGHLVHPWSSAAGALWSGVLALYALAAKRSTLWSILAVTAAFLACGGLHQLDAKYDFFGVGESPAVTPQTPFELAVDESGAVQMRLDADQTIGAYSLFRIGLLSIPWVLAIGLRNRACLLVGVLSAAAAALCFFEPLTTLLSNFLPIALLWRLRWLVPSAVNAALLGVCVYWAATVLLRRRGDRPAGPVATSASILITLGATVGMMAATPSRLVRPMGPVQDLTKCNVVTHEIIEELGGLDAANYVLTPEPPRCRISHELCQLVPNVRVMISRKHVIRWFLGEEELESRLRLMRQFYSGRMSAGQFSLMLEQFPFDRVIVDYSGGRGRQQASLLSSLGWTAGKRLQVYEVWRAPGTTMHEN